MMSQVRTRWTVAHRLIALAGVTLAVTALLGRGAPPARAQVVGTVVVQKQLVDAFGNTASGDLSGYVFMLVGNGLTVTMPATNPSGGTSLAVAPGSYQLQEQARTGSTFMGAYINNMPAGSFQVTGGQTTTITGRNQVTTVPVLPPAGGLPLLAGGTGGVGTINVQVQVMDAGNNVITGAVLSGYSFSIVCGTSYSRTVLTTDSGLATVNDAPAGSCTVTGTGRAGTVIGGLTVSGAGTELTNGGTVTVVAAGTLNLNARARGELETVQLFRGCNNIAVTWPNGTAIATFANAINPPQAVIAVWRYDNRQKRFSAYSPSPDALNDLTAVNRNEVLYVCLDSPGVIRRPSA